MQGWKQQLCYYSPSSWPGLCIALGAANKGATVPAPTPGGPAVGLSAVAQLDVCQLWFESWAASLAQCLCLNRSVSPAESAGLLSAGPLAAFGSELLHLRPCCGPDDGSAGLLSVEGHANTSTLRCVFKHRLHILLGEKKNLYLLFQCT